jgi:hypothetical protein
MDFSRFNQLPLDPAVKDFPGWTMPNERAFNRWYAAEGYTGRGEIVDLGCMSGSSSAALASGLAMNPRASGKRVHAFDRFVKSWATIPGEPLADIPQGGDFFHRFTEKTAPWKDHIEPYRCDIMTYQWPGEPIEYLLVDLMKSWDTARVVAERFFPAIADLDALVVHQDFLHYSTPWIHLLMFRLRNTLIPAFEVPESFSMVFRKEGRLELDACRRATDFDGVSPEEVDDAFAWSESLTTKNSRAGLRAAKAMFFCHYANRERKATGSQQAASRWMERAIAEIQGIEPEHRGHREVLSASKFIEAATGTRAPAAAPATGQPQSLSLGAYEGTMATIATVSGGAMRVEIQRRSEGPAWHVQLLGLPIPVAKNHRYTVSFRARSDTPRSISLLAVDSSGRSNPLGLAHQVDLLSEWREFRFEFTAMRDDDAARLRFNLGASDVAVELTDARFGPVR